FQRELHQAPRLRGLNLPDVRAVHVVHRHTEIGVIEDVEQFRAELQVFAFREAEILERREIPLLDPRPSHDVASSVAKLTNLGIRIQLLKCPRIEPAIWRSGMRSARARALPGVAYQVGPVAWEARDFRGASAGGNARGIVDGKWRPSLKSGD